jgi:hypothetical protein
MLYFRFIYSVILYLTIGVDEGDFLDIAGEKGKNDDPPCNSKVFCRIVCIILSREVSVQKYQINSIGFQLVLKAFFF